MTRALWISVAAIGLSACVSIPKDAGFSDLVSLTAPMGGAPAEWVGETMSELEAEDRISALLSEPLNEASVAEITTLSNQDLRAVLYGLKAARGDYRDATSLPNPFVSALFIDGKGVSELTDCFGTTTEISDPPLGGSIGISYDILDLLFLPRTLKAAKAEFDAAKYGSVRQFADIAYRARIQFYETMAAKQMLELTRQSHAATEASAEIAQALYDAGNIPRIELTREQLFAAQMKAELGMAERRFNMADLQLAQIMGLSKDKAASIKLKGRLRTPDQAKLDPVDLTTIMDRNLELKHREAIMTSLATQMGLKDVQSLFGEIEIEGETERHDGEKEFAFGGGIEIPIFNFGGGRREAARARLEQMRRQYDGAKTALVTTSDILYGELSSARDGVLLQRKEILPLSKKLLDGTQLDYNAMQTGVFGLLNAKREQLAAGQAYIQAVEDYWKTRARYEYLLAGGSPEIAMPMSGQSIMSGSNREEDH